MEGGGLGYFIMWMTSAEQWESLGMKLQFFGNLRRCKQRFQSRSNKCLSTKTILSKLIGLQMNNTVISLSVFTSMPKKFATNVIIVVDATGIPAWSIQLWYGCCFIHKLTIWFIDQALNVAVRGRSTVSSNVCSRYCCPGLRPALDWTASLTWDSSPHLSVTSTAAFEPWCCPKCVLCSWIASSLTFH